MAATTAKPADFDMVPPLAANRLLATRTLKPGDIIDHAEVTVNLAEQPLAWLARRGHITALHLLAGERLRQDYHMAELGPRVTMRWDPVPANRRGRADAGDPGAGQLGAKARFEAAVAACGPGLADVLWRVVCAGEGLETAERALGWPARAGKLVLRLALDRLVGHYWLDLPKE